MNYTFCENDTLDLVSILCSVFHDKVVEILSFSFHPSIVTNILDFLYNTDVIVRKKLTSNAPTFVPLLVILIKNLQH